MSRLSFAVREGIERKKIQKKSAEQERVLKQSEERNRFLFSNSNAVMLDVDPASASITDANTAANEFHGWPREPLIGKKYRRSIPWDPRKSARK